jgi:PadR family transcriptional regulator, regulatory protein PadR
VIRTWLGRRRREHFVALATHLVEHPDERHYGWDVAKATGQRPAVMYRLLARFLEVGWLEDGWEEKPADRPPRRYYLVTQMGRLEMRQAIARLEVR